ncbi:hypothetical protein [Pseudonocardia nigra]|uniref:hypothetical protein n=1 Tax=Pseudonocardia nigra TaxID=1921578 RepID=UPI001C5F9174|nr:hypothetical protein [Pseudonocardia nigra]
MSVLAAERSKLFSTRSPWWCSALAVAVVVGLTAMATGAASDSAGPMPTEIAQTFLQMGMAFVLVMAAVSVTTEYRFSTIRTTFQAVPNRSSVLLAKTAVVAVVAAVVGLVGSFGAWAAASLLQPDPSLALSAVGQWRAVAGAGLVFAVAAVIAVAVGVLIRQTAGAVSVLLVWPLLVENMVVAIPGVGDDIYPWMPFINAFHFLYGTDGDGMPFGPWGSLAYVAAVAGALLVAALVVANRRDA